MLAKEKLKYPSFLSHIVATTVIIATMSYYSRFCLCVTIALLLNIIMTDDISKWMDLLGWI